MKHIIITIASALAVLGTAVSCSDFLDVKPVANKSETDFANYDGVNQLVTGMYAKLNTTTSLVSFWVPFSATLTNYVYGDVMGGDANKGSAFSDQPDFTSLEIYNFTNDNSYLHQKWEVCYNGVFTANNVIKVSDLCKSDLEKISGENKDFYSETVAQARFMRAFWHFEIVKLFGAAVPYVSDKDMESDSDPKVSNVDENGNYIYIWDKIADDLQYAYDNLPDYWSAEPGRVNKWAAACLLAKVRLFQSSPYNGTNGTSDHWAEARKILEDVLANGKDSKGTKYRLADTYETLFTAGESDWTGESVFDIQATISGTVDETACINGGANIGLAGALGTGGWGFYQPSDDLANCHRVNSEGLPMMDDSYRSLPGLTTLSAGNVPHTDLTAYTDPRIDVSMGRFNVPYMDWSVPTTLDGWIRDVTNGGPYLNKKNLPKKADQGSLSVSTTTCSSTKNYHVIRFADVLLWYAECLIHDGEYAEAGKYINHVRSRAAKGYIMAVNPNTMEAGTSTYVFDDKVDGVSKPNAAANYRIGLYPDSQFADEAGATMALRWERRIGLAMEGHRWYDLVRWGVAPDVLNSYVSYERTLLNKYENSVYGSKWATMPIPFEEIRIMRGVLVQNENWL